MESDKDIWEFITESDLGAHFQYIDNPNIKVIALNGSWLPLITRQLSPTVSRIALASAFKVSRVSNGSTGISLLSALKIAQGMAKHEADIAKEEAENRSTH